MWLGRLALASCLAAGPMAAKSALAYTQPFTFHCTGNACRAVSFLDEGLGCITVTNHSRYTVHVTFGIDGRTQDIAPGDTYAPLALNKCYGYYDGGETANFVGR